MHRFISVHLFMYNNPQSGEFMARELTRVQKIEQSIITKYRKMIWAPFLTAINTYELIQPNDRIAVCISGGKDSMLLAKLMQMLQVHSKVPFELVFLSMDPGYKEENRIKIRENAEILGIDLSFFETNIFEVAQSLADKPCYMCARMRRGHLYNRARELGCTKIALGHHLNDVIETTVMSMFYSSKLETIIPKALSKNFGEMELIRPLYRIKEQDILAWARYNDLSFINCACKFTEENEKSGEITSKRLEVKLLLNELKKNNPEIEDNIFRAMHAVYLKTFPGYKTDDGRYSFLDFYPDGIMLSKQPED